MSKNHSHSLDRALTQEELDELKKQREACCNLAVEDIKTRQGTQTPKGYFIAHLNLQSFKDAFNKGWDKKVREKQRTSHDNKNLSKEPKKGGLFVAAKIGNKAKVVIKRLGKKMLVAMKFLTMFTLISITVPFLALPFLIDTIHHSKNKDIANRLSKLGGENAETEISKIISQKGQGDSLEKEGDQISNKRGENKSVVIPSVGVGITPKSSTQLSASENEMTKTP